MYITFFTQCSACVRQCKLWDLHGWRNFPPPKISTATYPPPPRCTRAGYRPLSRRRAVSSTVALAVYFGLPHDRSRIERRLQDMECTSAFNAMPLASPAAEEWGNTFASCTSPTKCASNSVRPHPNAEGQERRRLRRHLCLCNSESVVQPTYAQTTRSPCQDRPLGAYIPWHRRFLSISLSTWPCPLYPLPPSLFPESGSLLLQRQRLSQCELCNRPLTQILASPFPVPCTTTRPRQPQKPVGTNCFQLVRW